MDFDSDIKLENDRVRLQPLQLDDYGRMLPFAIDEPELWEFALFRADGEGNLKRYIRHALNQRALHDSYPFLVIDKLDNQVAGSTRFYDYQKIHKTVQLGYTWYGKEYQGTGLNTNCKLLLLTYAFETAKLERVEFRADLKNKRSIAAMKKIGCVEEGILRSNCISSMGRRDSIILSILKKEWFGGVKDRLEKLIVSR